MRTCPHQVPEALPTDALPLISRFWETTQTWLSRSLNAKALSACLSSPRAPRHRSQPGQPEPPNTPTTQNGESDRGRAWLALDIQSVVRGAGNGAFSIDHTDAHMALAQFSPVICPNTDRVAVHTERKLNNLCGKTFDHLVTDIRLNRNLRENGHLCLDILVCTFHHVTLHSIERMLLSKSAAALVHDKASVFLPFLFLLSFLLASLSSSVHPFTLFLLSSCPRFLSSFPLSLSPQFFSSSCSPALLLP